MQIKKLIKKLEFIIFSKNICLFNFYGDFHEDQLWIYIFEFTFQLLFEYFSIIHMP